MDKKVQDLPEEILDLNKKIEELRSVMMNAKDYRTR